MEQKFLRRELVMQSKKKKVCEHGELLKMCNTSADHFSYANWQILPFSYFKRYLPNLDYLFICMGSCFNKSVQHPPNPLNLMLYSPGFQNYSINFWKLRKGPNKNGSRGSLILPRHVKVWPLRNSAIQRTNLGRLKFWIFWEFLYTLASVTRCSSMKNVNGIAFMLL